MPLMERCSDEHRVAIGATRIGITRDAYRAHVAAGEKWCWACQAWHPRAAFGVRRSTRDGLDTICLRAANARVQAYQQRLRARAEQIAARRAAS